MWYLIIIIVLVYYWLYLILMGFDWTTNFNNTNIHHWALWLKFYCLDPVVEEKYSLLLYKFFLEHLYFLNTFDQYPVLRFINFRSFAFKFYLQFISAFIPSYKVFSEPKDLPTYVDIRGNLLFEDELFVFNKVFRLVRDFNKVPPLKIRRRKFVVCLSERFISYHLYSRPTRVFKKYKRINYRKYYWRKAMNFNNNSDFGLSYLFSIKSKSFIKVPSVRRSFIKNKNYILSDALFESFDFKHSLMFEFLWAAFPCTIIFSILIPSLYLLYSLDEELDPDFTIKVIGNQWYWSYEFNNFVVINEDETSYYSYKFDSNLIPVDDLVFGTKRLLEVDNRLVLPINTTLRFIITASDVLHSWAVPELGIKVDAVPGRLNQFIAFITRPGVFYGQCSEICGANHGFMPIVIIAISYDNFVEYLVNSL